MPDELRTDDAGARVVHLEREYDATPAEVWDAWTDPARLTRWLGAVERPLGDTPVRMTFGDGADNWADLTVVRSDPPRQLELEWTFTGGVHSRLRVAVEDIGAGRTRLVLEHRGLGPSAVGYGAGWTAYLVRLAVELGGPAEDGDWDARFAAELPRWQARAAELRD